MKCNFFLPAGFRLLDENTLCCPFCGAIQLYGEFGKRHSNGWVFCACGAEEKINSGDIELEMDPDISPQALLFKGVFPENYRVKPSRLPESLGFTEEIFFRKGSFPVYTLFDNSMNAVYQTVLTSPDPRLEGESALLDLLISRKDAREFFLIGAKAFAGPECFPIDTVFDLGLVTRFGYSVRVINQFPFRGSSYKMAKSRQLVLREDLEAYLAAKAPFLPEDLKKRIVKLDQGMMFYLPELKLLAEEGLKGDKELLSRLIAKAPVEYIFALLAAVKYDASVRALVRDNDKNSNADYIRKLLYCCASGYEKGHLNLPRRCLFWRAQCTEKFRFEPVYGNAMYNNTMKKLDAWQFNNAHKEGLLWITIYKRCSVVPLVALGFDKKQRQLVEWVDNDAFNEAWFFEDDLWMDLEEVAEKFKSLGLEFIVNRDYMRHQFWKWDNGMPMPYEDDDWPF